MKIRSYLAGLIFVCLVGGYLIEYVLTDQFKNIREFSESLNKSHLWYKDLDRIQSDTELYIISSDLILGSGESYLIKGSIAKGQLMAKNLERLARENQLLTGDYPSIADLSDSVIQINEYLEASGVANVADRDAMLEGLLKRYDPLAFQLNNDLLTLKLMAAKALEANEQKLERFNKQSDVVVVVTQAAFSLMLILLWVWSYRTITRPLVELRNMASASEHGELFVGVEDGPLEIRQLSENLTRLTNSLSHQAAHDPLTQLRNRRAFGRDLEKAVRTASDSSINSALCYIDLDRFKAVNDTCGHAAGDELLTMVARLIAASVRNSDVVARMGGDEFAILLLGCDMETAVNVGNKICDAVRNVEYKCSGKVFRISASIGITHIDGSDKSAADYIHAADVACKYVKESGRDKVHVCDVADEQLIERRNEALTLNQLTTAIDNNQFVLFKQNIKPLNGDSSKDHYEILIRMRSEQGELISPFRFLPLAERYNVCRRVDQWVVGAVIDWLVARPGELDKLGLCSINLSGQSIVSDELKGFIVEKIRQARFPAEKLCFEITETAAVTDIQSATDFIVELKDVGCQFALDDFGSGLSSFSYLKNLPVDIIKIDGHFVSTMLEEKISWVTVKSINDLAKALEMKTVAEFVETAEVLEELNKIGVDYAQGYYYHEPELLIDGNAESSPLMSTAKAH